MPKFLRHTLGLPVWRVPTRSGQAKEHRFCLQTASCSSRARFGQVQHLPILVTVLKLNRTCTHPLRHPRHIHHAQSNRRNSAYLGLTRARGGHTDGHHAQSASRLNALSRRGDLLAIGRGQVVDVQITVTAILPGARVVVAAAPAQWSTRPASTPPWNDPLNCKSSGFLASASVTTPTSAATTSTPAACVKPLAAVTVFKKSIMSI